MNDELLVGIILAVVASGAVACVAAAILWSKLLRVERRVAQLEAVRGVMPVIPAASVPAVVSATALPVPAPPSPVSYIQTPPPVIAAAVPSEAAGHAAEPVGRKTTADWEALIAGKWLNRVGLAAVAVGVAYFLKYAIDNDWIGPTGQVAIGLLLGAALMAGGSWLAKRGYAYFADGLAGLGASVLYLSAWAATSYYALVSPGVGFVLMVAITAGIFTIAIGRASQRIAMVALLGGLLTPMLVDSGQNRTNELFGYLALLDGAVLVLAGARRWRQLEWVAFVFTELYFWIWFGNHFGPDMWWTSLLFATVFFAEFLVLPTWKRASVSDASLVHAAVSVVNPAAYLLALHAILWPDQRWALTFASLALAALHLLIARAAPTGEAGRPTMARLLPAGLALMFVTVAVPIRLAGVWITCAWAVEAAVIIWVGFRVNFWQMRTLGLVLFALVALQLPAWDVPQWAFLWNPRLLAAAVTVGSLVAALIAARQHASAVGSNERPWFAALGVMATVLLVWALTREVQTFFRGGPDTFETYHPRLAEGLVISLLWIACATALLVAGVRGSIAALRWQGLSLFGIATVKVFIYDLSALRGFYRIGSSIALGVLLLGVSFLYQRRVASEKPLPDAPGKGNGGPT
jgi:uncharacterized membrane protein